MSSVCNPYGCALVFTVSTSSRGSQGFRGEGAEPSRQDAASKAGAAALTPGRLRVGDGSTRASIRALSGVCAYSQLQ